MKGNERLKWKMSNPTSGKGGEQDGYKKQDRSLQPG